MNAFQSEQLMTKFFRPLDSLGVTFGYEQWMKWQTMETKGLFGVPDHLVVFWKNSRQKHPLYRTIACEMKLIYWRRALVQAYRYKAFAHYSIVVMDRAYVHRASKYTEEFQKANVGLAALSTDSSLEWIYRPRYQTPYSEPVHRLLRQALIREVFVEDSILRKSYPTINWNVLETRS
jgi:hypothetical protein